MSRRSLATSFVIVVVSLSAISCASNAPDTEPQADPGGTGSMDHGGDMSSIGGPGSAGAVDRTIALSQVDTPSFDPASVAVTAGETIRFEITNDGADDHEFVLGDEAMQSEHGNEMDEMDEMAGDMASGGENAVSVEPGATEVLIWKFDEPGTVLYGCHVNGHYDAGMVGTISIAA